MIAATAALIIGVQYLKGNDILNRSRTFYGVYENVTGLAVGTPVSINGIRIGQVTSADLMQTAQKSVVVTFSITDRDVQFPKDSQARLESTNLMGDMTIAIKIGRSTTS